MPNMILTLIVIGILLASIIGAGFHALSVNNAVHGRKNIIPNIFSNIGAVLFAGLKLVTGVALVWIALWILLGIVMAVLTLTRTNWIIILTSILAIIAAIIITLILLGQTFYFFISLKFSDFFALERGSEFRRKAGGKLLVWFLKVFLVGFMCALIGLILLLLLAVISKVLLPPAAFAILKDLLKSIIQVTTIVIAAPYCIDLTAQFIRDVYPERFKKEANKIKKVKPQGGGQV